MQNPRPGPSGLAKKKNFKDREKRKSQASTSTSNNSNSSSNSLGVENGSSEKDKSSLSKDSNKEYAGISSDSIRIYAEQISNKPNFSEDVCNILAEDINYKLRYILQDSLVKARLQGRDAISSSDLEETFTTLNIDKVYGAPSSPNWVPFDQNLSYLDDTKINLIELAEQEEIHLQPSDVMLTKTWRPDTEAPLDEGESEALKEYFTTMCNSVISNDAELRQLALQDISENPSIGPIIEWFYHFVYFLLMKNVTYGILTVRALNLLEVLENSPLPSQMVSVKQLKLLIRLLMQRLLMSIMSFDTLKPMCSVLAILCLREPLRKMVITKINKKIYSFGDEVMLPVFTIIYFLGIEGVKEIFIPCQYHFLNRVSQNPDPDLVYMTLAIYGLICKAEINDSYIHRSFYELFGGTLCAFWKPWRVQKEDSEWKKIDFVTMKNKLIRTRRKVDRKVTTRTVKRSLEEVFDIPQQMCRVRKKLDEFRNLDVKVKKETHFVIGKTSLLLSVLRTQSKTVQKCCDHFLLVNSIN